MQINSRYDAHVRARDALIRRVVIRMMDWGGYKLKRGRDEPWPAYAERAYAHREALAIKKLAAFRWEDGWGDKLSKYYPFGPRQTKIGTLRQVHNKTIHHIMCTYVEED